MIKRLRGRQKRQHKIGQGSKWLVFISILIHSHADSPLRTLPLAVYRNFIGRGRVCTNRLWIAQLARAKEDVRSREEWLKPDKMRIYISAFAPSRPPSCSLPPPHKLTRFLIAPNIGTLPNAKWWNCHDFWPYHRPYYRLFTDKFECTKITAPRKWQKGWWQFVNRACPMFRQKKRRKRCEKALSENIYEIFDGGEESRWEQFCRWHSSMWQDICVVSGATDKLCIAFRIFNPTFDDIARRHFGFDVCARITSSHHTHTHPGRRRAICNDQFQRFISNGLLWT